METQLILKIIRSLFPEDRFIKFDTLEQFDDEFEYIKSIRKVILEAWKNNTSRKEFLLRGIDAFQEIRDNNFAHAWNILINEAYLHEYLKNEQESNNCLIQALKLASIENDRTVGEKADRFFQHFTRKSTYNDKNEEWYNLLERQDRIVGEVSEGTHFMVSMLKKYGNNSSEITSQIITSPQEMLQEIEADLKHLLKLNQNSEFSFRINLRHLDQDLRASLKSVKNQTSNKELSNKCDVLLLILLKVMISARGVDNPRSFRNYANLITKLYHGKKNGLDRLKATKNFYAQEEEYIEKAIDLGEIKKSTTKPKSKHANRIYISLSDMYRIRGKLKMKKEGIKEEYVYDFEKADNVLGDLSSSAQSIAEMKLEYGNDTRQIISRIIEKPKETLQDLENDLKKLLKQTEKGYSGIDLRYLDQIIGESLRLAKHDFSQSEFSTKYDLLLLFLDKIRVSTKSDNPNNCISYARYVDSLYIGKRNGLDDLEGTKRFYAEEEEFLEKAIELGEQKIATTEFTDPDAVTIYCLLASMYRIRGHIKKNNQETDDDSLSDFYRAVELFRKIGNLLYNEAYFDRNVERFAECLLMSGEYEATIVQYKKLFEESETKKYQGALGLGRSYSEKEDLENAEYWYFEAKKIDELGPGAYDGMVHVRRKQGRFTDAIKWRRKMLKLPEISKNSRNFYYYDIEELYREDGTKDSLKEAVDVYNDVIENQQPDRQQDVYKKYVTALIELKGYIEAISQLHKKSNSDDIDSKIRAFYLCKIGDCYAEIMDSPDRKEKDSYQKALIVSSDYVPALQRMISWYEKNSNYGKAIEEINYMIENVVDEKESDSLWKWKGDLKRKSEDYIGAFKAYEQCFSVNVYRFDAYYETRRLLKKQDVQKKYDARIENLINEFQKFPTPKLARKLVKLCLLSSSPKYANVAERYLGECNYNIDSAELILDKATIHEIKEEFEQATRLREQLKPLGNISVDFERQKLNNLTRIIQSINRGRLYKKDGKFRKLRSQSLDKLVKFLETKVAPNEEAIQEIEIEGEIYHYRETIWFVADQSYRGKQYKLALEWIQKLTHSDDPYLFTYKIYLFKEAETLFRLTRYPESIKVLDKILKYENNQDALAFILKGKIYRERENKAFSKAVDCFNSALKINKSENNEKVPPTLDQLGLTYRIWARQTDLTDIQKKELKCQAIESYKKIIDDYPNRFDKRAYHGLAQSHLIKPAADADIDEAGSCYYKILKKGLDGKEYIRSGDVDRISLYKLLRLWGKTGNTTLKKILLDESRLLEDLDEANKRFVQWKIIKAAKDANIFYGDVFDTIAAVFNSDYNFTLRQHACQYFMKYLISTSYNASPAKLRGAIENIVDILIGNNQDKQTYIIHLALLLGAERHSYLKLLTKQLREDLEEISDRVFNLKMDHINIHQEAEEMERSLRSVKSRAQRIGINKADTKDLVKIVQGKERHYKGWAGNQIELNICSSNLRDIIVPEKDRKEKENILFDCLDLMKRSGLNGICTLSLDSEPNLRKQIVDFKLNAELQGSFKVMSEFKELLKERLDSNTPFKFNKGTQHSDGNQTVKFEISLELPRLSKINNPYKELLEYINHNSFQEENEIRELKEKIEKYISGNKTRKMLQKQVRKYIYSQLEVFSNIAKGKLMRVLDIPHILKNLIRKRAEIPEYQIEQLQSKFKNLNLIAKDVNLPKVEDSFSLLQILKHQKDSSQSRNEEINFTLQNDENESYLMVGEKEAFKMIFKNIIGNSVNSVKEKLGNKSRFNPAMTIRISKNYEDKQYEIRFIDNGVGVKSGTKFEQLKEKNAKGTGVGLPAVSSILREYEGNITIESAQRGKNSGITFLITIPIRKEE